MKIHVRMALHGQTQVLVDLYTKEHLTCAEIATRYGVTRQAIAYRLRNAGVTSEQGEWVNRRCAYCQDAMRVTRKRARTHKWVFCNQEHYYAFLGKSGYQEWRHGGRLARAVVAQHFELLPEYVVHHKDGDQRNNDRANLMVFESNSDHMAHHRGRKVTPLWGEAQPHDVASG